jgi:hypothetical protein
MRILKSVLTLLIALTVLAAAAQEPTGLVVQADESLGPVSPYILGSNFTIYSAIPAALIPQAQTSGVGYLRWGGGFSDERDLEPFMIDTFMATAQLIGAEPAITVRLRESTPADSAEDVRYANLEQEYNIRYWSIGNEPSLYSGLYDIDYTTEQYNQEWRAHAEAMLAVDPNIILVGPDVHQYYGVPALNLKDSAGRDWVEAFLQANGDLVGVVSIHRYPFPRSQANPVITIEELRQNSREWDENIIPALKAVIQETTGRDIPIAVAEVNSSWANNIAGEATLDSHYNAIWYADVVGRLIRQGVMVAGYFDFQRRDASFGLLGGSDVRPSYYTYQMYQRFGTEALASSSDDLDVGVYAARREDGALTLMVVNLALETRTLPLTITGFTAGGPAEVWLFDPDHEAQAIGSQSMGAEITVPGQSVTLYIVPGDS